jgi:hypothetical protein
MMLVLSALDRHKRLGAVGPGAAEDVLIDGRPEDHLTRKVLAQPVEGGLAGVHDGDGVALLTQLPSQARADPAAAHNHCAHLSQNIVWIVSFSAQ